MMNVILFIGGLIVAAVGALYVAFGSESNERS